MKKRMIITLVLVFVLGIASTAFAGPFADVPAKHWSYDAVNKLVNAGIVSGYPDGSFQGDRIITRYEMAQIVGKAMANSEKADAENKALINKLADEYAQELNNLGVRVTNLENKVGNIKITGQVREWYEYVDEPKGNVDKTALKNRLLLYMDAPLSKDLSFKGRYFAESEWGSSAATSLDQAYLVGKNFTFGRQPIHLGKGLVYSWGANQDGVTVTVGNKVKVTGVAFKHDLGSADINLAGANVAYDINKNLDMTLVYAKTKSQNLAPFDLGLAGHGTFNDTWAAGFGYKGIKNIGITAEYGQNDSDAAKLLNGDTAKAWVAQIKYLGADWAKPNTYGVWVGYRKADNGFLAHTGDLIWETATNIPTGYMMNNVKGMDFGIEYTVFNNGVMTLQYQDFEAENDGRNAKNFTAQLRYMF